MRVYPQIQYFCFIVQVNTMEYILILSLKCTLMKLLWLSTTFTQSHIIIFSNSLCLKAGSWGLLTENQKESLEDISNFRYISIHEFYIALHPLFSLSNLSLTIIFNSNAGKIKTLFSLLFPKNSLYSFLLDIFTD